MYCSCTVHVLFMYRSCIVHVLCMYLYFVADSLEWAVKLGRVKEAFTLLTGPMVEYNFSHTDIDGLSVLHHATINRMTPIVSVIVIRLKKYSCSVDIPDSHGITPYLHARRVGCNEIADMLLEAGASPHQADTRFHMTANSWTAVGHQEQEFQQVCLRQKGVNELMIAGRLPALRKRNMAHASSNTSIPSLLSMTNFSQSENNLSQTSDTLKITSLFDLKLEGSTVDKFYNSINERDSPDERGSGGASTNDVGSSPRQQKGNSVVSNLGAILDLVSQQMSDAFQPGVKRPDPSQSSRDLLAHDKGSTLAAIMGLKRRSLKKSLDAGRRKGSQASGNGKLANKKYTPLPVIAANADD